MFSTRILYLPLTKKGILFSIIFIFFLAFLLAFLITLAPFFCYDFLLFQEHLMWIKFVIVHA